MIVTYQVREEEEHRMNQMGLLPLGALKENGYLHF